MSYTIQDSNGIYQPALLLRTIWEGQVLSQSIVHEDDSLGMFERKVSYYLNLEGGRGSGASIQLIHHGDIVAEQYIN